MTKEQALELLKKNPKDMTVQEKQKIKEAIKIVSTIQGPI